ncbi:MAG: COG1470 family protein [Gemmatimonadaceae bacterium]
MSRTTAPRRRANRRWSRLLSCLILAGLGFAVQWPQVARAQTVAGGDFDICDFCGSLRGNRALVRGRAGFGTERAVFVLVNAATVEQDVDNDGFTPGVNFTNLIVSDTTNFVSLQDPSRVIVQTNLVIADFLNPLNNGFQQAVSFFVNVPAGTPAGMYRGRFTIQDTAIPVGVNPNGEALRVDAVDVDVEVLPESDMGLFQSDTSARLDSLTLRGRPGQTVRGVVRLGNLGNVPLSNVRLEATDLVATSGTGLRIRRERISFSPVNVNAVDIGDTVRVEVTVRIPPGLLAGTYRGELIAQGDDVDAIRIPFSVIVTTPGDIVFETNPVVGRSGDLAVIIFNADPGSAWELAIFDMMATTTFRTRGTVFQGTPGDPPIPGFAGDEAIRYTWPLVNGRGENVAGGMYYVVINAVQGGEQRQLRGKLMIIR